jgi:hypothetical protein
LVLHTLAQNKKGMKEKKEKRKKKKKKKKIPASALRTNSTLTQRLVVPTQQPNPAAQHTPTSPTPRTPTRVRTPRSSWKRSKRR